MQLEQLMMRDATVVVEIGSFPAIRHRDKEMGRCIYVDSSSVGDDAQELETAAPVGDCEEKRLAWLRSQIIDQGSEFLSPFGRRRLTYADHTATGRSLHYIETFITRNVLPFYGNSHTADSYVGRRTIEMVNEASRYIKNCLGGGADDAIFFCGSGSTAAIKKLQEMIGITAPPNLRDRVLELLTPQERWIVMVGPYEHHSNLLSWRQSLAAVVEIGLNDDGEIDIHDLRQKLESCKKANRPILGSFSACSNVTGICSDTRTIATILHQYGGFACFDFAASGPYQDIDMKSGEMDGYDAIFLSPHKFLGGPGTTGILLMNKKLYQLRSFPPSTCGGGTVNYVNGFDDKETMYIEDIEERENAGTPPITQMIRAALTFWVKEFVGYEVIMKREEMFIEKALERMSKNKFIWVLGNTTIKRQAILSFMLLSTAQADEDKHSKNLWTEMGNKGDKPLHGPFVAVLLNDLFGIQARGGCSCAGPYGHILLGISREESTDIRSAVERGYLGAKPGWARISFPYYMSIEEFEFILAAVEFVASFGQRFLPLYHFNFNTGSWTAKKSVRSSWAIDGEVSHYFTFPSMMKMINLEQTKTTTTTKMTQVELVDRFKLYLESAKHIANTLPKFPPQRMVPKDLSPEILQFRV